MPGFTFTFLLFCAVAALTRYVSSSRERPWVFYVILPGLLGWLVCIVFAGATLTAGAPDTSGMLPADASSVLQGAEIARLRRIYRVSNISQYIAILTFVIGTVSSAWVWWSTPAVATE